MSSACELPDVCELAWELYMLAWDLDRDEDLLDAPEEINNEPYEAWFIKVTDITETEELLDADAYDQFVQEEEA